MNQLLKSLLIPATLDDIAIIQKMWAFYVYDLERECGLTKGWDCLIDPSGELENLTPYFSHPNKKAFLIKSDEKFSGFAFISKLEIMPEVNFFLSEFFIAGNFQNKGVGKTVAIKLFNLLKGKWGLGVLPQNKKALVFWRKTLAFYTKGQFSEVFKTSQELKTAEHPEPYPLIIFTFDSNGLHES